MPDSQSKPRSKSHTFQPPKGTRDFYPADMAVRRYIESVWREVSINHGFDEIEGPNFEHLELYTVKSGPGIVSELFSFRRAGGDTDYALRPEFTPTLARMFAAKASSLPAPTKWFCIPNHFRAERPQRGRLREFIQWNIDIIGDDSPGADAEIVACAVGVLERLGLRGEDITVRISNRDLIARALAAAGVAATDIEPAMIMLDKREKLESREFTQQCARIGLDWDRYTGLIEEVQTTVNDAIASLEASNSRAAVSEGDAPGRGARGSRDATQTRNEALARVLELIESLQVIGILRWCEFDASIVRGLAYYTGNVFEIHEAAGKERAIAGGGRYDGLIELFGGPPTPAVGIAMGDVVLRLVLEDKGLLKVAEEYMPRPDVFVISSGHDLAEAELPKVVASLRRDGFHVRYSYRATRNVGKLLGEASKARARFAAILGKELAEGKITLKNLDSGEEEVIAFDQLPKALETIRAQ